MCPERSPGGSRRCAARASSVGLDVPALSQYDAVVLFVERARRARPSFAVSDANAPAVAQICHRLDGIPLALELAAARCRQLSAERIASELDDRFRLLTGGARTVMARQQTLAASVDWSHERLDDAEQRTFRRLGVFAGRFPLEAAEAVVSAGGDVEPAEVFDLISRLVDKSLVAVDEGRRGEPRYRLLETLRAYALDRARTAGELTAHAGCARRSGGPTGSNPAVTMPTDDILDEIEEFHANLIAALDWSADDPPLGLRLLRGVAIAWEDLGRAGDAMAAADRLLTDDNAQRYGAEWLGRGLELVRLVLRGSRASGRRCDLFERIEAVAGQRGDEYYRWLARWPKDAVGTQGRRESWPGSGVTATCRRGRRSTPGGLARRRRPRAAAPYSDPGPTAAAASGMRSLRDWRSTSPTQTGRSPVTSPKRSRSPAPCCRGRYTSYWDHAVAVLSFAALLARDEDALRLRRRLPVTGRCAQRPDSLTGWTPPEAGFGSWRARSAPRS